MKKALFFPVIPLFFLVVPQVALASNLLLLNGSDSIVPTACRSECPCGVGGALQFVQNIMNVMISIAVIFMIMFIVWAGFLFIMSVANPESRSKARSMLINAVIGMVIVLAAWLIVDFVMKTLYGGGAFFGPWNQILQVDGNTCIVPQTLKSIDGLGPVIGAVVNNGALGTPGSGGGAGGGSSCDSKTVVAFPAYATDGQARLGTPETIQRFIRMREAALKDGVKIQAGSTYRPDSEQLSIWNARHCSDASGRTICQSDLVAKPCSLGGPGSNHTKGTAIDMALKVSSSGTLAWLRSHAKDYGFYNQIASEPFHWSDTGH